MVNRGRLLIENFFRENNEFNEITYTIALNTRYKDGFKFIKDELSITQVNNVLNDTFPIIDRRIKPNPDITTIFYTTLKSDGDVFGSSYRLDTSYYNYIVLEEVTEAYLKARFQARLLKRVGEQYFPKEEDPDVVTFTDAMIIAERQEE